MSSKRDAKQPDTRAGHPGAIGVVVALEAERRALNAHLAGARGVRGLEPWAAVAGSVKGLDVWLLRCGPGPERARAAGRALGERSEIGALLVTGYCGALHADLAAGDVVIASALHGEGDTMTLSPAPELLTPFRQPDFCPSRTVVQEPLLSAGEVLVRAEDKARAARSTSACGVDMESFHIVTAFGASRPWIVVRSVLDEATLDLPPRIDRLLDASGRTRPSALLPEVILAPARWGAFAQLARRQRRASRALSEVFPATVESIGEALQRDSQRPDS